MSPGRAKIVVADMKYPFAWISHRQEGEGAAGRLPFFVGRPLTAGAAASRDGGWPFGGGMFHLKGTGMSEKTTFEFESTQELTAVHALLVSILDGLAGGRLVLSAEGKDMDLTPAPIVRASIKARRASGSSTLSFSFRWKTSRKAASGGRLTVGPGA